MDGEPPVTVDQSLAASSVEKRDDNLVLLRGDCGDSLTCILPETYAGLAATYNLAEPVLARLLGPDTARVVVGEYPVTDCRQMVGGMGAGYALAFNGTLRFPLGGRPFIPDETGAAILRELSKVDIKSIPSYITGCSSDSTLLLTSDYGDKLAVGVREALVRWHCEDADRDLVARADALVFCGAPNSLMADVLAWAPDVPVMCAPAMRNVCDEFYPLAELASYIDYLTMNSLEWQHLVGREKVRREVPVVTVTDGPRGSRIYFDDGELAVPTKPRTDPVNTNRAGETYGSTFFKVLLHCDPEFHLSRSVDVDLALHAGQIASAQANRQLDITDFAFPPDDWDESTASQAEV